ncbi:MAG: vWA domain-containing protein [Bacteroidales bacterium]|jgi:hypothetical protein
MKQGLTDITAVVDESFSMMKTWLEIITGINNFIEDQRTVEGDANLTMIKFDDFFNIIYSAVNIKTAPFLSKEMYKPRGNTALLDAMGETIVLTGKRLAALPESERPEKVIILFQTDGEENASKKYTKPQIDEMIKHQKEVYNWDFIFLGANQDAIGAGTSLGVSAGNSMSYAQTNAGTINLFSAVSKNMRSYRGADYEFKKSNFFDDSDRTESMSK